MGCLKMSGGQFTLILYTFKKIAELIYLLWTCFTAYRRLAFFGPVSYLYKPGRMKVPDFFPDNIISNHYTL